MERRRDLSLAERKSLEKLLLKKFRSSRSEFVVENPHLVTEALASDWQVAMVVMTNDFAENPHAGSILAGAHKKGTEVRTAPASFVAKFGGSVTPQGVFAVVTLKQSSPPAGTLPRLAIALDGVADPGNVGTIIRTADWFGIGSIYLGSDSADPYNPKVVRASMGSIFHVDLYPGVDLAAVLKRWREQGGRVVAAEVDGGTPVGEFRPPEKAMLLFGNEAAGIRPTLKQMIDGRVTIPRTGKAESLNVAISCGIILSHLR